MSQTYTVNTNMIEPALNDAAWPTSLNSNWSQIDGFGAIGAGAVRPTEQPSATLNCAVSAVTYRKSDGTAVTYPGTSSFALTANQTNTLWLTDTGTLTKGTSGLPASTNVVPIATVVCGASTITSITDLRQPFGSYGASLSSTYALLSGNTFTGPPIFSGSVNNAGLILNAVTIPAAPTEGQICDDAAQLALYGFVGSQAGWFSRLVFSQTASVNFNTTNSLTTFMGAGKGSATLAANSLAVGKTIRVRARGFFPSTKTASPGTFNFVISIGSVTAATLAVAPTLGNSLTNAGWSLECDITVRAIGGGTSTNVFAQGMAWLPTTNADNVTMNSQALTNSAVSSGFDSTATQAVAVKGQFGTNDATNSVTATNITIEIIG